MKPPTTSHFSICISFLYIHTVPLSLSLSLYIYIYTIHLVVVVNFLATGNAPLLKRSKFKVKKSQSFGSVVEFLRKQLQLDKNPQESLVTSSLYSVVPDFFIVRCTLSLFRPGTFDLGPPIICTHMMCTYVCICVGIDRRCTHHD